MRRCLEWEIGAVQIRDEIISPAHGTFANRVIALAHLFSNDLPTAGVCPKPDRSPRPVRFSRASPRRVAGCARDQ